MVLKLANACSSILERIQYILRDIHPFCVVTITDKVTPNIFYSGMGIICLLIGIYTDIGRDACDCSLQVRKGIDVINLKFIASQ